MNNIHRPSWFSDDEVVVSTAPTCGLTKGGRLRPKIDENGQRVVEVDPETGGEVIAVDDVYLEDATALVLGERTPTLRAIPVGEVSLRVAVPAYYDRRYHEAFGAEMETERFRDFTSATLGELLEQGVIDVSKGHGSPGREERVGDVPYIKVSDLRAGLVNINPTNRVPNRLAEKFWGAPDSGLRPFDLLSPERTSKNIGDFCVLMPGQERVVLTKEVIVLRPGAAANFSPFYLLWALTLKIVRDQWHRVVFMQTNREDVGSRWLEIEIPVANSAEVAEAAAKPFASYYEALSRARTNLGDYLKASGEHHFFISGAEPPLPEELAALVAEVDGVVEIDPEIDLQDEVDEDEFGESTT